MTKKPIWRNIRDYFDPDPETVILDQSQKLRLSGRELRIPLSGYQEYRIEMGKQTLILSPDPGVAAAEYKSSCDFILFDPERRHSGVAHFLRLSPGSTLTLD
ncbi:MAG: hypothetical protein OEU48_02010, partial [Gammaproteobacteria bacterium]|nr:hypothetical protein [Gammaproteobacteria bacterium]